MNETSTQRHAEPWSRVDRVPDGRPSPANVLAEAGILRPTSGKFWGVVGLVILTGVTSLVVATISIWLTPVYMAAMVLIFAAPRPKRPEATASPTADAPSPASEPAEASTEAVAGDAPGEGAIGGEAEAAAPAEDAAAAEPPKPRKRRAKGKRAAKAAALAEASSSQPTWIRVGPGKFVRADLQDQDASSDAEVPAEPPLATSPETPDEIGAPTEAETEAQADAEPTPPPAPDAFADAGRAVEPETPTEATPASAFDEGPSEIDSPALAEADEAAPTTIDEEYGIAPSALVEPPGEEYGIAPSALAESWEPEALPEAVPDDEPEPASEGTPQVQESEPVQAEAQAEVPVEVEHPVETWAPVEVAEKVPAEVPTESERPTTIASPLPERPAPEGTAAASPTAARPAGLGLLRRSMRPRERRERLPAPRSRGQSPRTARPGRAERVRVGGTPGRDRDRSNRPPRRPHPRSPPRRA
ncbi:hypothetical protein [Paludisphaera soli]|uniref:hypothetical protein n=1 Tax=Paludisphaera soli TaxID=2712865 RepID=UPI0013ED106E|nr:hypothetical protein [Paludisphaera soli]